METSRRKALGKGLGALIPAAQRRTDATETSDTQNTVPIQAIKPSPYQPRHEFAEEALDELARSIKQNGVIQPLVVRRAGSIFELIAGERRWRAAQRAGLERVPVIVKSASDREALELALVENLQREDLNPLDEAMAYQRLMDEFELTQDAVAERVAKSRPAIANSLRLLSLPEAVKAEIRTGKLSGGHARAIAGASTPASQVHAAREVVRQRLNVRATENLVRDLNRGPDADRLAVEDQLRRALGTKVRLKMRSNGRGAIEIEYYSLDELQGLIDRLTEG